MTRPHALQGDRKRKMVALTLSDEAREKLTRLAADSSKSAVVERLILAAREPRGR